MRSSILATVMALLVSWSIPACGTDGGALPAAYTARPAARGGGAPPDSIATDVKPLDATDLMTDGESGDTTDLMMDGDSGDTAEVISPPPNYHPLFDFVGTIELVETVEDDGSFTQSQPRVFLGDEVQPIKQFLVEEEGDCQFYQALLLEPDCTPECIYDVELEIYEWCHPDGHCRNHTQRHSAGTISFAGLLVDLVATPDDTAFYTFGTEFGGENLFDANVPITLSAPGDELPPLTMELTGVADLAVSWGEALELVDGSDNVAKWVPAGNDATVELIIQTGWHGSASIATIWCSAPDAEGQISIPQHMVEMYPIADGGVALEQHPSFVRRVKRQVWETDFGPVQVFTSSEYTFFIRHF